MTTKIACSFLQWCGQRITLKNYTNGVSLCAV